MKQTLKIAKIKGIVCTHCGKPCIHLKELFEHYQEKHPEVATTTKVHYTTLKAWHE